MPREPPVTSATRPLSENRSLNMMPPLAAHVSGRGAKACQESVTSQAVAYAFGRRAEYSHHVFLRCDATHKFCQQARAWCARGGNFEKRSFHVEARIVSCRSCYACCK